MTLSRDLVSHHLERHSTKSTNHTYLSLLFLTARPFNAPNLIHLFVGNWLSFITILKAPYLMGQPARLEESRSDLHCNGSRVLCLTEPLRQPSSQSHWGIRWTRRPRPSPRIQRRERWGFYRGSHPSGGSYSTSCSFLHRGPLHQIHEGIHGDDAGSGTSRATRTTT